MQVFKTDLSDHFIFSMKEKVSENLKALNACFAFMEYTPLVRRLLYFWHQQESSCVMKGLFPSAYVPSSEGTQRVWS
jgi:hypothetical protein